MCTVTAQIQLWLLEIGAQPQNLIKSVSNKKLNITNFPLVALKSEQNTQTQQALNHFRKKTLQWVFKEKQNWLGKVLNRKEVCVCPLRNYRHMKTYCVLSFSFIKAVSFFFYSDFHHLFTKSYDWLNSPFAGLRNIWSPVLLLHGFNLSLF